MPSPRASTACTRPSSSARGVPGARSTRSSSPLQPGLPGGMPSGSTGPAATSRRPSSRPPTISAYRRPPRPPEIQSPESPRNPVRFKSTSPSAIALRTVSSTAILSSAIAVFSPSLRRFSLQRHEDDAVAASVVGQTCCYTKSGDTTRSGRPNHSRLEVPGAAISRSSQGPSVSAGAAVGEVLWRPRPCWARIASGITGTRCTTAVPSKGTPLPSKCRALSAHQSPP